MTGSSEQVPARWCWWPWPVWRGGFSQSMTHRNWWLLPWAATVNIGAVFDGHDSDNVMLIVNGVDDPMIAASRALDALEVKLQRRASPVGILSYRPV
jgi:hypothetical protein